MLPASRIIVFKSAIRLFKKKPHPPSPLMFDDPIEYIHVPHYVRIIKLRNLEIPRSCCQSRQCLQLLHQSPFRSLPKSLPKRFAKKTPNAAETPAKKLPRPAKKPAEKSAERSAEKPAEKPAQEVAHFDLFVSGRFATGTRLVYAKSLVGQLWLIK